MQSVSVTLSNCSYDILIGAGILSRLEELLRGADLKPPFVVISQPRIFKAVGRGIRKKFSPVIIPDGERAKSLTTVSYLLNRMAGLNLNRQSTVIALGGGIVGDVVGFAASIFMRGIAVVQAPTTLLAQVDSSIGGKTAVNHRTAKNLIGTFHQPRLVVTDPLVLSTLPEREYRSGLYEALKYGVISDRALFEHFEKNIDVLLRRDADAVEHLVTRCAAIKAKVVMADEREQDLRRILNFGHTIGHALETARGYQRIKHGEAVGYGMIAASRLSSALHWLEPSDADRIEAAVRSIGRLPGLDGITSKSVLAALQHDKKVRDGAVHFVLAQGIGRVAMTPEVPLELVRDVVKRILDEGKIVSRSR